VIPVALVAVCVMLGQESADLQAVKEVCGKCHAIGVFLNKPRAWDRWNDVFADMTRRGADGTTDQLALVTKYFLQNLTLVNVNTSPAEELGWVLEVSDNVVATVMAQRQVKPFANLAQLKALPGVDAAKLEQRKTRIIF
jgi:DNA uptake protein ComE-like DNA-binding protein